MTHVWWRRWLLSAAVVVSWVVAGRLGAQCTWQTVHTDPPGEVISSPMVFDSARRCSMLIGGGSLASIFEWDGELWRLHDPANRLQASAAPSYADGMAYDTARSQTVVLAGTDTWVYNGNSWTHLAVSGPTARSDTAMAYDSARGRIVLFGGEGSGSPLADTWEWDGAAWTLRATSGPPARSYPSVAYDSVRQRVVVFGGIGFNQTSFYLADTWEWDGSTWTQLQGSAPGPRYGAQMTYDSARGAMVVFGGFGYNTPGHPEFLGDTWVREAAGWVLRAQSGPPGRKQGVICFDSVRGRAVLYGGHASNGYVADTWEWDGAAWTQVGPTDPPPRSHHALVYDTDNNRALLFGGNSDAVGPSGDTWSWSDDHWTQLAVNGPSGRDSHAMAYDAARHQVVLFGGRAGYAEVTVADTWVFDGAGWSQRSVQGPSARFEHAMAYDEARQRVVLFGGMTGSSSSAVYFGDTWEWDGASWTQIAAPGPSARAGHLMTYDAHRQRIVLVGGTDSASHGLNDTWEWDGFAWEQHAAFGASPYDSVTDYPIAYDPVQGRTIVFGGYYSSTTIWGYDGLAWTAIVPNAWMSRSNAPMVYEPGNARMILFGGYTYEDVHGDTLALPSNLTVPAIGTQPTSVHAHVGDTISFSVTATGVGPLSYQWMHGQYLGVVDGPGGASGNLGGGGVVSGATTPTLTITGVQRNDLFHGGEYYCAVSNACTTVNSHAVYLTVLPACGTADFDGDGMPGTDADIEAFFACLGGSCCATCYTRGADFNADGDVGTDADIDSFFRVLSGGSC